MEKEGKSLLRIANPLTMGLSSSELLSRAAINGIERACRAEYCRNSAPAVRPGDILAGLAMLWLPFRSVLPFLSHRDRH